MGLRRDARRVTLEEAPEHRLVLGIGDGDEVHEQAEGDLRARGVLALAGGDDFGLRRLAVVEVPDGIAEAVLPILALIAAEELQIFVDRARE